MLITLTSEYLLSHKLHVARVLFKCSEVQNYVEKIRPVL